MLTVPTTSIPPDMSLPIPGGWTGVCLTRQPQPLVQLPERGFAAIAATTEAIRSRPIRRSASINP